MIRSVSMRAAFCIAVMLFAGASFAQDGPQSLPRIKLTSGMHVLDVEVAQTEPEHEIGLMFRKTMPTNAGMIFIFDRPAQQCFWMKNTLLPLSVAFIADDGTIVN